MWTARSHAAAFDDRARVTQVVKQKHNRDASDEFVERQLAAISDEINRVSPEHVASRAGGQCMHRFACMRVRARTWTDG